MKKEYEVFLQKCSILLAEDEESVAESFKKVLLLYVGKVYLAANGEEAYALYKESRPDIIITDIKMSKTNGLELIKKIRKENRNIPIIVTSAYTDQDLLLESIKLSLVEYIVKPIKGSDLIRLLEECAKILSNESVGIVEFNNISSYDYDNKIFNYKDEKVALTQKEVIFFEFLLAHRGNLVTKRSLEDELYIYKEASPTALKNLVFKLRKKIGVDIIKTVGKLGYMIENLQKKN